jgi:hypothetical protein
VKRLIASTIASLVVAGGASYALAVPPTTHQAPRVCFDRDQWNTGVVPASKRPCARIVRLYEDGSFKVRVSDADGTVRYSLGVGAQDR